jgi:hypothetical protein
MRQMGKIIRQLSSITYLLAKKTGEKPHDEERQETSSETSLTLRTLLSPGAHLFTLFTPHNRYFACFLAHHNLFLAQRGVNCHLSRLLARSEIDR